MKILNITKKTTIAENVTEVRSLVDRTKGLLGSNQPKALILRTRFGIHTFGMNYPIDVIILSSKNVVVAKKENIQPNNIFVWSPRYNMVLELPGGSIQLSKTHIEDKIQII